MMAHVLQVTINMHVYIYSHIYAHIHTYTLSDWFLTGATRAKAVSGKTSKDL